MAVREHPIGMQNVDQTRLNQFIQNVLAFNGVGNWDSATLKAVPKEHAMSRVHFYLPMTIPCQCVNPWMQVSKGKIYPGIISH
jgi:hypothetical protein